MKRVSWFLLVLLSGFCLQLNAQETSGVINVQPELFQADEEKAEQLDANRILKNSQTVNASLDILLPAVSDSELKALRQANQGKKLTIGFGRDLPEQYHERVNMNTLSWSVSSDGGKTAVVSVTSPGAAALRLLFDFESFPEGVELRFFSPNEPQNSQGPVKQDQVAGKDSIKGVVGNHYWSPTVDGDTLAVEIYLPAQLEAEKLLLGLLRVSHLQVSPLDSGSASGLKRLVDIGNSASCNIDIECIGQISSSSVADISSATIASVAKYSYTSEAGFSHLCTGTLLTDTVSGSQIPYFLTANHCIGSQSEASSTEYYWFFKRNSCGGANPSSVVRQSGGADLLVTDGATDTALLRLNSSPPGGAGLSGWSTRSAVNQAIAGIHHPGGDLKKGSLGETSGFVTYSDFGINAHIQTNWNNGITEPGSSGSGIWLEDNGSHYLVGSLTGGAASCSNLSAPDYYGRFNLAFAGMRRFLAPDSGGGTADTEGRLLNISTSGLVDADGVVAGFIVGGGVRRVVVMGEHVSLSLDPQLQLTDKNGEQVLYENNDWQSDAGHDEVVNKLRAPRSAKDAAFVITLQPGAYLAKLSGVGGSTGRGVVSITEVAK